MTLILTVIVVALISSTSTASRHGQLHCHRGFDQGAHAAAGRRARGHHQPGRGDVGTAVAQTIAAGWWTRRSSRRSADLRTVRRHRWNLITWRFGMPSSSSHALVGPVRRRAGGGAQPLGVIVCRCRRAALVLGKGVLWKVIVPMVTSPACGLVLGLLR